VFAHIINGLVFITVLSCGITSYYVASRCLTHIADLGIIHPWFGKKDAAGRPWLSLILSGLLGGGLTYLNLNNTSAQVYNWFSNLVRNANLTISRSLRSSANGCLLGWRLVILQLVPHLRRAHPVPPGPQGSRHRLQNSPLPRPVRTLLAIPGPRPHHPLPCRTALLCHLPFHG
jgi:hypothetical protein